MIDVAVVGAGVAGASIARTLSAYRVSVALLEREVDVSFGVSKANSGIVHAGFHHAPGSLKARLEVRGNLLFDSLKAELGFPFSRCGIFVAAFSIEEMQTVAELYSRGVANGVPRLEVVGRERLLALEPKLSGDVVGGLYAPTGGIVEPYRYVFALVEWAVANGVELRTGWDVARGERRADRWVLRSRGRRHPRGPVGGERRGPPRRRGVARVRRRGPIGSRRARARSTSSSAAPRAARPTSCSPCRRARRKACSSSRRSRAPP